MKAALYERVSTLEQAKYGFSLEAQSEKMIQYCKSMDYEIYDTFSDDGFTGASTNRPALISLKNAIINHLIDIVIIYKLDRLSRDVRDTLNLVDLFVENNVQLYSLSEQIDLTSPFGRAALTMSATFSAMERDVIKQRSIMGKEQKAKNGQLMGYSKNGSFFGYKNIKGEKRFEIVPEEAAAIREIFDLYVNQDFTIRKLYPYMREKYKHPFFSNSMCCKDIINRLTYTGYFMYKGNMYKGINYEPIISYELYLKAQEKKKANMSKREPSKSPYLLTGLLFCGECGNRFVGKKSNRYSLLKNGDKNFHSDTYYGCAARIKRDKNYMPIKCMNKIFQSEYLDNIIDNAVVNLKFNEFTDDGTPQGVFDNIFIENKKQEEVKAKLLDLYLEEKITKEIFERRSLECDSIINKNNMIIKNEQIKLQNQPSFTINYIKEKQKEYFTAERNEKRRILKLLIKRIIITNGKLDIKWRVK